MALSKFMQANVYEAKGGPKKSNSSVPVRSDGDILDDDHLRLKRDFAIYKRDTDIALEELHSSLEKCKAEVRELQKIVESKNEK